MDAFLNIANDILRWGMPVAGLAIMCLAWRRFDSAGARLAAAGFAIALVSPAGHAIIQQTVNSDADVTPEDIGVVSALVGLIAMTGTVVMVLALRRLIADAEAAPTADQAECGNE